MLFRSTRCPSYFAPPFIVSPKIKTRLRLRQLIFGLHYARKISKICLLFACVNFSLGFGVYSMRLLCLSNGVGFSGTFCFRQTVKGIFPLYVYGIYILYLLMYLYIVFFNIYTRVIYFLFLCSFYMLCRRILLLQIRLLRRLPIRRLDRKSVV